MNNIGLKPFSELVNNYELVQLDGLGGVQPNLIEHDNPLIECFFSPVTIVENKFLPNTDSKKLRREIESQFKAGIAVGYLPSLVVGKLYKNGIAEPISNWEQYCETIELDIDTSDITTISETTLRLLFLEDKFSPLSKNFSLNAQFANVKKIDGNLVSSSTPTIQKKLDDNKKKLATTVVISEFELIRFYMTNSGYSCKQIFTGAFQDDAIFTRVINANLENEYGYSHDLGCHRLVYRHGYKDSDASTLARILFQDDDWGLSAAQRIYNQIIADRINHKNGLLGYPRTHFPFKGKTRLKLIGRRIKAKNGDWLFHINRISGCSAAFPFQKLSYCDEIEQGGGPAPEDASVAFENVKYRDSGPAHEGDTSSGGNSVNNERPSNTSVTIESVLGVRNFEGLNQVKLVREKLRDSTYRSQDKITRHVDGLIDASTGKGTAGISSAAKQSLSEDILQPSPLTKDLKTFLDAIIELRRLNPTWRINSIGIHQDVHEDINGRTEIFSCFPSISCKVHAKSRQFSYMDKKRKISRRFLCIEVFAENKYVYIFEAQRRESDVITRKSKLDDETKIKKSSTEKYKEVLPILILYSPLFSLQTKLDFFPIIENTVIKMNWPLGKDIKNFIKNDAQHCTSSQSVHDLCEKIKNLIQKALKN